MSQMCPNCSFDNPDEARTCSKCPTPLRGLLGADTLLSKRYQVTAVLGCGSMGAVYLAKDTRLAERRCAIKENRIDPNSAVEVQKQSRDQFLAEANVLAKLDHPNLPKVSDYFIENDREYLVMDYVEGEDLESRMSRTQKPLEEKDVVHWTDQVLDALAYLHTQKPKPIIHRDIKPANLRVDMYNRVKLVDFGLVKLYDANSPETKAELRGVGTPAYAPLEQFAGSDEHTDARSDIYSLGATMYHMLTHLAPIEVHQRLLKPETLILPQKLNPNLSSHTAEVVLKAISVYPNERYQNAQEMRQALLQSAPAAAAAKKSKEKKSGGISVLLVGAAGLIIVLLLLGAVAYFMLGSGGETALPEENINSTSSASPTEQSFALLEGQANNPSPTSEEATEAPTETPTTVVQNTIPAVNATPAMPPTDTPAPTATNTSAASVPVSNASDIPGVSLVGTIAYPVFNGTSYDLYIGRVDGSGTSLFRQNSSQPAFSPDGSRIAFHSWSRDFRGLVTMGLDGSNPVRVATFVEDQLPTWSADGTEIVLLTRRSGARTSQLVRVGSTQAGADGVVIAEGEYPTIGATGQLVFRAWGNTGSGLRSGTLPSLNDIKVITDNEQDTAPTLSPDGEKIAFMSRRGGNWEIYMANADGSDVQRLTEDPAEDGLPAWSPDGAVLAFLSNRGGNWAVWAITPTGDNLQKLFDIEGSPDGFVGNDSFASRGWAEERISWTR